MFIDYRQKNESGIIQNMMEKLITIFECPDCQHQNAKLAEAILKLPDDIFNRRSHLFHGRYENLYIDSSELPGMDIILSEGLSKAAEILKCSKDDLKYGFWLNVMNKGDVTTLHSHDDDDELLSAVYYVQSDEGSAVFHLHSPAEIREVKPVAGRFMFFDPALPHEVTEHLIDTPRISIGINFGPATEE